MRSFLEHNEKMNSKIENSSERPNNGLLQLLDDDDFGIIGSLLEHVDGTSGDVLYHPGDEVEAAHFPCGSTMVSLLVSVDNGIEVETVLIGREGAVGVMILHRDSSLTATIEAVRRRQETRPRTC